MKAITYSSYGTVDVLDIAEVDKPVAGDEEVLIAVHAASLNPYDWHFVTGLPYIARAQFGLRGPRKQGLGADLAGRVEAVGREVTGLSPGDEVFGQVENGAFAEYVCAKPEWLALKPQALTFEQAAAVPMGALTALQGLRDKADIQSGQTLLINGAAGGVGTFAVQLGRTFGAEVTGVCSTRNVEMVGSLGATDVIDYTREDFTQGGPRYDVILDLIGNHSPSHCRRALTRKGVYLASYGQPDNRWLGPMASMIAMMTQSAMVSQKMRTFVQKPDSADLRYLTGLIESDEVAPVIDRTYSLAEVPEGIGYLEEGHARGKVVIAVRA